MAAEIPTEKQGSQSYSELPCLENQSQKKRVPRTAGYENHQGLSCCEIEGCVRLRYPIKGPKHRFMQSQTLHLCSREGTTARKASGTYKEEMIVWLEGIGFKGQLSPVLKYIQVPLFLC